MNAETMTPEGLLAFIHFSAQHEAGRLLGSQQQEREREAHLYLSLFKTIHG